ncbi:MAG: AIM24 family protein [Marinagarivorans sp.]
MSNSFNVVLTGELLKGQSIMQAANSLSRLFKIAPIQAQQMLARAPLVIKKNLEHDTAIRFAQAMYKSGFGASVEEQKSVKTTYLHPFSAHYEEEDEEEAAVTPITPVLVEQSRLEESLDTELTIPAPQTDSLAEATHAQQQEPVSPDLELPVAAAVVSAQAMSSLVAINPAEEDSNHLPDQEPLGASSQTEEVAEQAAEDTALAAVAQAVEEIPVECSVVLEETAPHAAPEQAEDSAQNLSIEPSLNTLADLEPVELEVETTLELEAAEPEAEIAVEVEAESAVETTAANENYDADNSAAAPSIDPFASWQAPSQSSALDSTLELPEAYGVEEIASSEDAGEAVAEEIGSGAGTRAEPFDSIPVAEVAFEPHDGEDLSAQWSAQSMGSPEMQISADAAEVFDAEESIGELAEAACETLEADITAQTESAEAAPLAAAESAHEPLSEVESLAQSTPEDSDVAPEIAFESQTAAEDLEAEALLADEIADTQVADVQVADVQWLEPVAQWQTVAELAEDMPQQQGLIVSYESAEQPVPVEAVAEQGAWNDSSAGVGHFGDYVSPDSINTEPAEPAAQEPTPTQWDDAVEITPALTERLAQIAQASKESLSEPGLPVAPEDNLAEPNEAAEGVLLFEEADVTEIASASWDDWHASDGPALSGAASFNPLLDFDQVVPDWQNSSLELMFDAPHQHHHSGLTAENEQELAAFLHAEDARSEPQEADLEPELLMAAMAEADAPAPLANLAPVDGEIHAPQDDMLTGATQESRSASAWSHEISVQANCGFLEVIIPQGRELHVAAAASVTMGLSLHEQLNAGSSVRAWLLAKGFVLNTYEAVESAGNLGITAITHGMVCAIEASDFPVMVQQSAYLASTDDVQLNADQSRLNPVVSASKWIHCSGTGELWLNAQGLWEMVEVDGCYRINSRYLMAYSKSLDLKAPPLAGLKSYLTSGSGVECRLTGRGVVWVQTEASRAPVLWQ